MDIDDVKERLIRLEAKVDMLLQRDAEHRSALARVEGRVWAGLVLALTSLVGLVTALLAGR